MPGLRVVKVGPELRAFSSFHVSAEFQECVSRDERVSQGIIDGMGETELGDLSLKIELIWGVRG